MSQIFKILFFKLEISALHGQSEQLSAKEQGLKYALSEQEKQQNDITEVVLEPYLLTLNIFFILFYVEHVVPAETVKNCFAVVIK